MKNILITGGAGFIGSHVANHFYKKYPEYNIFVLDDLLYAANEGYINKKIKLLKVNICNYLDLNEVFVDYNITDIIHLAAESHVDNSIKNPTTFIDTNIVGTHNLLILAKKYFNSDSTFYHVSTDEVYGHLSLTDKPFTENTRYDPRSPYSASKAASDHLVRSYYHTFNLPIVISNCSNNYGPHQHLEKLIPKTITNALKGDKIPVYGTGENIRDWLWVGDHVSAIDIIFHKGKCGETYNVGGNNEISNINIVKQILDIVGASHNHIEFVEDRLGHDFRYAIDNTKLKTELGWEPKKDFISGIKETTYFYGKIL